MINRISLSCILLLLALTSCKKTTREKNFEGSYKAAATIQVEPPMMFTKNGMIHDLQLIKDFLARDTSIFAAKDTGFIFNSSTEINNTLTTFNFTSNDTVTVTTTAGASSPVSSKYVLNNQGSELQLSAIDSSIIILNNTQPHDRFWTLSHKLEKNNTGQFTFYNVPGARWAKAKYNGTLLHTNGNLLMPITRAHFHLAGTGGAYGIYWNNNAWLYLNMNIQNELLAGDTLVVQQKTVTLLRQ